MQIIKKEQFTELHAEEGNVLKKDDVIAEVVILGKLDKPENWEEIRKDAEEEEEL